eukprot:g9656.t1
MRACSRVRKIQDLLILATTGLCHLSKDCSSWYGPAPGINVVAVEFVEYVRRVEKTYQQQKQSFDLQAQTQYLAKIGLEAKQPAAKRQRLE